jgi:hypothetical protein
MLKSASYILIVIAGFFIIACGTAKTATGDDFQKKDFAGNWTITDIQADVPEGYRISNIFDEAPYKDFQSSAWTLDRNGFGNFTLKNGKTQQIYWSLYKQDTTAMFQFKKIAAGEKPKNIDDGYRLEINNKINNSFILQMPVPVNNAAGGHLRLTFTKLTTS